MWTGEAGLCVAVTVVMDLQQIQIFIGILLLCMAERPRLFRPCLSTEKVFLVPRLDSRRKLSQRRAFTTSKATVSASVLTPSTSPPTPTAPVHNYSFIGRQGNTETRTAKPAPQLQLSQYVCPRNCLEEGQTRLKRVHSIKLTREVTFDAPINVRSHQRPELDEVLVIRPVGRPSCVSGDEQKAQESPKRQSLSGKAKTSFLQFYKSRKRSIKVSHSPVSLQGMLLRFLQIRKSRPDGQS